MSLSVYPRADLFTHHAEEFLRSRDESQLQTFLNYTGGSNLDGLGPERSSGAVAAVHASFSPSGI